MFKDGKYASSVLDNHRNRVDRYEGTNEQGDPAVGLDITMHPQSPIGAEAVQAWYWAHVGVFRPVTTGTVAEVAALDNLLDRAIADPFDADARMIAAHAAEV